MIRKFIIIILLIIMALACRAQNVTIRAVDQPAASVFREIMAQTGKNFVYSTALLSEIKITIDAENKPLRKVLNDIFRDTDIAYKIKGQNVLLKRKDVRKMPAKTTPVQTGTTFVQPSPEATMLKGIEVVSRLEAPAVETAEIGAKKITAAEVRNTPTLFGEADVIKALHTQPGITEGSEGMAGMNVHGGEADENLYMLDNVPLYQVNHFAGLFSAFNNDVIRYIDFFKSSIPAKYDGRLSSFLDVRLQNGSREGHHGSGRLGLTSGSFNISGPIGSKTTYLLGVRRSWYDVLTIPFLAILNSSQEEKIRFHYAFMDLNAKVSHRFSTKATGFVSVYFGNDMLRTGSKDAFFNGEDFLGSVSNDRYDFHWGNLVAQTGLNYRFTRYLSAEFTAAYTRYFSSMKHYEAYKSHNGLTTSYTEDRMKTDNNINDWIFRSDFDWQPADNIRVRFGANYVRHSFLPARSIRSSMVDDTKIESRDSTLAYGANEMNAYIEDDWRISDKFRVNLGLHTSLFNIDGSTKHGISPRISLSYRPGNSLAFKASLSRTTQYVHQLTQTYLALPTDQWIPVTGKFKPQTADKVAVGAYWQTSDKSYAVSAEAYYKWSHNLLEYRDEWYLRPPMETWNARLTSGRGTAKGLDIKIEKLYGKITGHISYSLAWADRTFEYKNGGRTYPARFDNRHTIKILLNWRITPKVQLNAVWTGHSGNRFTLLPQMWESPDIIDDDSYHEDEVPLRAAINNYQLPFYHRLDLSLSVRNRRGYWTFGLYNAYNHLNVIAVKRGYKYSQEFYPTGVVEVSKPVIEKVKLLPIIPSISYTWEF